VAYEITPASGFPATPASQFPPVPVRVINFTGTAFTCSRGTGEQSNVITIRMTYVPPYLPAAWFNDSRNSQYMGLRSIGGM